MTEPLPTMTGEPFDDVTRESKLCAWLEAIGLKPGEIESKLDLPTGSVYNMRVRPEYRTMLTAYVEEEARKRVEGIRDVAGLFNDEILASVATLIAVRDNPLSKEGDRIKAAKEFLDRAPNAPKAKTEVEAKHTVVAIPVRELQNMQKALEEDGTKESEEVRELLEGIDWEEAEP